MGSQKSRHELGRSVPLALVGSVTLAAVILSLLSFANVMHRAVEVGVLLILLVMTSAALPFVYRVATRANEEYKSRLLTADIITISEALTVAREGDLTVELPASHTEVGLVSMLINGLLADYSRMVAGIIRASQAVHLGAWRIDESMRAIVSNASDQSTQIGSMSSTVEELAESALVIQDSAHQATSLAAAAAHSVESGEGAVQRMGEAVDAIKEATIGTTREFKRLQEDSIRLTALVSSVKNNAENLDMQAANATLEARHLGTETGAAFATNIGRLARQAQETLAEADTAVRSVVTSIDAVNRRIERISEQVRRGVDEVHTIRATFADITATNQELVQFIEEVAGSTHVQASNAQQVAAAMLQMAAAFQQFNNMLIMSGDEMAHMRLIVANLQESVADLKVDAALLVENDEMAECAA